MEQFKSSEMMGKLLIYYKIYLKNKNISFIKIQHVLTLSLTDAFVFRFNSSYHFDVSLYCNEKCYRKLLITTNKFSLLSKHRKVSLDDVGSL